MRVYADNAATTKLSPAAKEAMLPYFDEIYGNPSTLYTLGQEAAEHLLACRTEIAQLIGAADPREIVFTSGGSEADNQAIISAARNGARKGKKHLISTKFEHHAVLHTLDKLRKEGFDVTLLDVHENGVVRVEDVAAAIREDTALVSVMFAMPTTMASGTFSIAARKMSGLCAAVSAVKRPLPQPSSRCSA